jgi:hypothetical protein
MSFGDEHFESPTEPVNGSNVVFTTEYVYQRESLFVFRNGTLILASDDDGWLETGDQEFETRIPWHVGDRVTVRYLEA